MVPQTTTWCEVPRDRDCVHPLYQSHNGYDVEPASRCTASCDHRISEMRGKFRAKGGREKHCLHSEVSKLCSSDGGENEVRCLH